MKKRYGFVSNSSSSNFIVLKKDENMSFDEMKAKSIEILTCYCDYEDEYVNGKAEKYAKDGKYVLLIENVEWGGEEAIGKIIPKLLEKLGVGTENILFEWGE